MIIATMLLALSQSALPVSPRPEPVVCERSERDPATGSRLWCPTELRGGVPQRLLPTMPVDGTGKGWALLRCDLGEGGVTTGCTIVEESEPGSAFGVWAARVQLKAIVQQADGNAPPAGDGYYARARWEVR